MPFRSVRVDDDMKFIADSSDEMLVSMMYEDGEVYSKRMIEAYEK